MSVEVQEPLVAVSLAEHMTVFQDVPDTQTPPEQSEP